MYISEFLFYDTNCRKGGGVPVINLNFSAASKLGHGERFGVTSNSNDCLSTTIALHVNAVTKTTQLMCFVCVPHV